MLRRVARGAASLATHRLVEPAHAVKVLSTKGADISIPIVPLEDFGRVSHATDDEIIASAWGEAMADLGFALVRVPPEVQAAAEVVEARARRFFAQPLEIKKQYQLTEHYKWG